MAHYGKFTYTDPYLHYKKNNSIEYAVVTENKPDGSRFYAKDYVDFRNDQTQGQVSMINMKYLTIITPYMLDFNVDDEIVALKDGNRWRINAITIKDDNDNKHFSSRPRKFTILELVV